MWKRLIEAVLLKNFSKLKIKNKQLQNTLKQLKSNVNGLNLTLLKLRCCPRTSNTCSDYSKGTFLKEHFFSKHLFLNSFWIVIFFLMNWISISFVTSFATIHRCSAMWEFLKIAQNWQKNTVLDYIFNKANFQSATFFKKETPAQVFSCELCEILGMPVF